MAPDIQRWQPRNKRQSFWRGPGILPVERGRAGARKARGRGEAGDSLCIGEKNTSDAGAALVHLYWGTGFPWPDLQLRVTLPFTTGFPAKVQMGGEGGTEGETRSQLMV